MRVVRGERALDHFTMISNDAARDGRLSLRGRGLLVLLLSYPDGWSTSTEAIAAAALEGREAVRAAMRELEHLHYVRRLRMKGPNGRFSWVLHVEDVVGQLAFATVARESDAGASGGGSPGVAALGAITKNEEEERTTTAPPARGPNESEAQRLAVLAFEQSPKPDVARPGKAGPFPAVRALILRRLDAGVPAGLLERVIRSGPLVWTLAGLQTAEALAGRSGGRATAYEASGAILAAIRAHGRTGGAAARQELRGPALVAVERLGWGPLCAMDADAVPAAVASALGTPGRTVA